MYLQIMCVVTACLLCLPGALFAKDKQIIGWIETVRLTHNMLSIDAKIDTGARHSSLHTENYQLFEKNNEPWIRFKISNKAGKSLSIEKPVIRTAKIKSKRKKVKSQERPVIMLGICIGSVYKEIETNIVDRSHFNYKLLIGRSFLKEDFLIDTSLKYSLPPTCNLE